MDTNTTIVDAMTRYFDETFVVSVDATLPPTATFQDIIAVVDSDTTIGKRYFIKVGNRCVIAERRFTWQGRVAKTSYLHIFRVNDFKQQRVLEHWREQKDGSFKTV